MKLQLKVFSGSWWATENRKQTQKPKGQPEGIVPYYKNNSLFSLTLTTTAENVESVGLSESAEKNGFLLVVAKQMKIFLCISCF